MTSTSSRRSADERRAEIARAARDLGLRSGLPAITMRAVAAELGVAPTLVVHYVPSMEHLVAAAFTDIVATELAELRALAAAVPAGRARLMRVLDTLLDGARADVTLAWIHAWALGRRNEPLATAVRVQTFAWRDFLAEIVVAGVAVRDFRVDDPAAAAAQILGMIDGLNAQSLVAWQDPAEQRRLMTRAVDAMLGVRDPAAVPQ